MSAFWALACPCCPQLCSALSKMRDCLLSSFCVQTRGLYAPFESDLRSSSSDVYYHEMPGGQYTNLKFQVRAPDALLPL